MKKAILVLTTSFPALADASDSKRGGFFLFTDCLCLVKAGYIVHVLSPMRRDLPESEAKNGVSVKRFKSPFMKYTPAYNHHALYDFKNVFDVLFTSFILFSYIFQIRRYVTRNNIDLIWANWLQVGYVARLAVGRKVPVLTTIRGSDIRNMPAFLTKLMAMKIKDIFNMHADEELNIWIKEFGFKEISVPSAYKNIELDSKSVASASKNIVVIGRLENHLYHIKHKGIGDQLFSVLKRVLRAYPGARVYVIGDGAKTNHFQSLCSDFSDRIQFLGWRGEFDDYLSLASIVIGASGLAGVTLDAVPYGIPIIVSKHDPSTFFWRNKYNCLIYDPLNEDDYYSTIEFALNNPELIRQYASNAKEDLKKYALPLDAACEIWRVKIDEFIETQRSVGVH